MVILCRDFNIYCYIILVGRLDICYNIIEEVAQIISGGDAGIVQ
ncbi:hypothetical protein CUS_6707 [Ruminococcus albus 8]|uniref:Uncharacterized protein n=1 Tax=Ruminococcus albus 8 TaxID=246199 RepID=E9SCV3_RUMAL|nr:hypothetical protein CUS_6707 [Ruminococcus albus 8]